MATKLSEGLSVKDVVLHLRQRGYFLSDKAIYKFLKEKEFKHVRKINKGRRTIFYFDREFVDELIDYIEREKSKLTAPKIYEILKKEGFSLSLETLYKILRSTPSDYVLERKITPSGRVYKVFKPQIIDFLREKLESQKGLMKV